MTFSAIPSGSAVFLDANVFVYHFAPHPVLQRVCQELLERVSRNDIRGFTSSNVLSDVAHRLMTYEASAKYGWPMTGIAYRLQSHPAEIQALSRFRQAVDEIPRFNIDVLPVSASNVADAASHSQQHGLLSGDALVLAVMREHGLSQLASYDADFDRVPSIQRFAST